MLLNGGGDRSGVHRAPKVCFYRGRGERGPSQLRLLFAFHRSPKACSYRYGGGLLGVPRALKACFYRGGGPTESLFSEFTGLRKDATGRKGRCV